MLGRTIVRTTKETAMPAQDRTARAKRLTLLLVCTGVPIIAALFAFADPAVDTWVASLGMDPEVRAASIYTHLGDRVVWQALFFAGVLFAVAAEWLRGPTRAGRLAFYCCVSLALAMTFGDLLKFVFGRDRPELLLQHGLYGFSWFAQGDLHHSFPSGHTLRTFSVMAALALRFPRAGWVLITLAGLEAASRVMVLRHYPSDVVCGALVGMLAALWADAVLGRAWDQTPAPGGD